MGTCPLGTSSPRQTTTWPACGSAAPMACEAAGWPARVVPAVGVTIEGVLCCAVPAEPGWHRPNGTAALGPAGTFTESSDLLASLEGHRVLHGCMQGQDAVRVAGVGHRRAAVPLAARHPVPGRGAGPAGRAELQERCGGRQGWIEQMCMPCPALDCHHTLLAALGACQLVGACSLLCAP